jgi:hypothetical protein
MLALRACSKQSGESILPVRSILTVLLCLTAGGCAEPGGLDSAPQPRVEAAPPDEKKLVELVGSAFKTAKLSGAAEVSPVHATHDNQLGDWMVCIKSSAPDQPQPYAVLIKNNAILEIRSRVAIDGCNSETYRPIEIANDQPAPAAANSTPAAPPPRPRRSR